MAPDRSCTATPVAGSGPMTAARTTATAAAPVDLDGPFNGVLSRIEYCRRNRTPVDGCDAAGDRRRGTSGASVSAGGQRVVVTTIARQRPERAARIIKGGRQFRPSDPSTPISSASPAPARTRSQHPRIVAADMPDQGRGVRRQQLGHIRVQRVVGEEALRAGGQQRDLDVEQRAVQTGDAVPATGGPPSPQPMAHGQPAQRVHRPRHDVDAGEFDGAAARRGFQRRRPVRRARPRRGCATASRRGPDR